MLETNTLTNILNMEKIKAKTAEFLKNKTLIVVYNTEDFSQKEIEYVNTLISQLHLASKVELMDDLSEFCVQLAELAKRECIVLNLSRRDKLIQDKLLVESYCDIRNIPTISSSGFTLQTCRNRFSFQNHLCQNTSFGLTSFILREQNKEDILSTFLQTKVVVKENNISPKTMAHIDQIVYPPLELDQNKLAQLIKEFPHGDYIIQEQTLGDAVTVDFFRINGRIYPIYQTWGSTQLDSNMLKKIHAVTEEVAQYYCLDFYGSIAIKVQGEQIKICEAKASSQMLLSKPLNETIQNANLGISLLDTVLVAYVTSYKIL